MTTTHFPCRSSLASPFRSLRDRSLAYSTFRRRVPPPAKFSCRRADAFFPSGSGAPFPGPGVLFPSGHHRLPPPLLLAHFLMSHSRSISKAERSFLAPSPMDSTGISKTPLTRPRLPGNDMARPLPARRATTDYAVALPKE